MINRLKVSTSFPSAIGQFIKDKIWYVFLYILFLSIFTSLPTIVKRSLQTEMDSDVVMAFEQALFNAELPYVIENHQLKTQEKVAPSTIYNNMMLSLNQDANETVSGILYNFKLLNLEIYIGPIRVKSYTYEEMNVESFHFNLRHQGDNKTLKTILDYTYNNNRSLLGVSFGFGSVVVYFIEGLFFSFMLAIILMLNTPRLKFKYRFIISAYAMTMYYLMTLIGELFGFGFLMFIGLILAVIYVNRAYRGLLLITVRKMKEDDHGEV